ncbi:type III-A CRISPR-associated RAMP protein Csm4 [Desulfoluna butyratoxydans]|uniref:CRISPR system Cms protein Csm4 n=1 Tax=Desulfoluna butyratoxydans TaxID=231438 RepID=A0A4U8YJF0_9BACT|nr:hypothetical protein [Desulfoluna butyratoxydans]VFQ43169.1 hypothetical protein MSL71_7970 [Desulfoluna butyratoxydans]
MEELLCIVKPTSPFGTPLKGDTLFGQLCWEFAMDPSLIQGSLDSWIARYEEAPFLVVSSAFFPAPDGDWILPVPSYPCFSQAQQRKQRVAEEKAVKKKTWFKANPHRSMNLSGISRLTDKEAAEALGNEVGLLFSSVRQSHNSINRLTGTTGKEMFAPYETKSRLYQENVRLALRLSIDTDAVSPSSVSEALRRIGMTGFGRDAGVGFGQYEMLDMVPWTCPSWDGADALYLLGPAVPEKEGWETMGATPFVRYGKHGNGLATSGNPFKAPVLMAAEGSLLKPMDEKHPEASWVGSAVTGVSSVLKETVVQGYAHWLPVSTKEVP